MENEYDRYGGDRAWEAYCEEMDRRRETAFEHATCADCLHCPPPPDGGIGWCERHEDYVHLDGEPCDIEVFEERI